MQVDCQDFLSTSLMQVVSTTCSKSAACLLPFGHQALSQSVRNACSGLMITGLFQVNCQHFLSTSLVHIVSTTYSSHQAVIRKRSQLLFWLDENRLDAILDDFTTSSASLLEVVSTDNLQQVGEYQ